MRISTALKSLRVLSRALDGLPDSMERAEVLDGALDCIEEVARWRQQPPTLEESERVMIRLLKLHVTAVRLRGT